LIKEEIIKMLGKHILRKFLTLLTAVAVWCVYSTVALAAAKDITGEITIVGQVTINGQAAVSNSTIVSGSTIVTGTNSSATISLAKAGRVELLSDTTLTLKFSDNSIVGMLSAGKVRVWNAAGIATTFTTKNSTVIADTGQSNTFTVDVGCGNDAKCSQTFVETIAGLVMLRTGTTDKQVAAGTDAVAGNPSQTGCQPCPRPGSAPPVAIAGPWWLLLIPAALIPVIFLVPGDGPEPDDGTPIVVSPIR
jgi:hypothetical protein